MKIGQEIGEWIIMNDVLRTSNEWNSMLCKKLGVLYFIREPDGWDRTNFSKSYYEEKITKEEFESRLMRSTLIGMPMELVRVLDEL